MAEPITVESVKELGKAAEAELQAVGDDAAAEAFRIKYLGKKGALRAVLKNLGSLPPDQRREVGAEANRLRAELEERFKQAPWRSQTDVNAETTFDFSLPPYPFPHGSLHPLMQIRDQIRDIFITMGFDVAHGPDVETDYYNYEALNFPPHHPARDMQDTFHVNDDILLRSHTSPVQIRVMEKQKPPIRSIMPGRCYRHEEISSRSYCVFHQVEGLYIDEDVSFADLKSTLLAFSKRFFDPDTHIKIRPSFFPFTEPSVEVDVKCFLCKGTGCSVCKHGGWLEILGAGMVHPNVLASGGIDSEKYTGFAFGMGIERIALMRYGMDDIRLFYENDVRMLRQF